jgi:hypothetical protein
MNTCRQLFAAAALVAVSAIGPGSAVAQYPGAPAPGQAPPPMTEANRAMQIAQARQANAALMHQYMWTSRVEIIKSGTVKDMRIEQVSYDPNGQLQHTIVNDQGGNKMYLPTPIGFLRRAIADNEKEEMEKYLTGLKGMLEQYTLPTAGKILDFMMSAKPSGPDANGLFQMSGNNVVIPGDNLSMWVNPWTQHVRRMTVNTTFQGGAVQLDVTFATVPGTGLNYASMAEATVPDKQLNVQVQNYNYVRY